MSKGLAGQWGAGPENVTSWGQDQPAASDWCQNCGVETPSGTVYCDPCVETLDELGLYEGDGKDNKVATE